MSVFKWAFETLKYSQQRAGVGTPSEQILSFHGKLTFSCHDISNNFFFPPEEVQVFQRSLMAPMDIFPPDFPENSKNSLLIDTPQADLLTNRHRVSLN